MNAAEFAAVPALRANGRLTVVIPARNEASRIGRTLAALARQRQTGGTALAAGAFDVVVFANGCTDGTAAAVRAFAARCPHVPIHLVEGDLPREAAHVGMARKLVMDAAAARFLDVGLPAGLIGSTDADTIPDDDWIAWTLAEAKHVDAVTGRIELDASERAQFSPALRELYLCDAAYQQTLAEIEATYDPVPHDPFPRHAAHFGASFAVRADAYVRAGGLPAVPHLEDLALYRSLLRIDARVRHSPHVRVTTSARRSARVAGGFATYLADLDAFAGRDQTFCVEHPRSTLARFRWRGALRRAYARAENGDDRAALAEVSGDADLAPSLDRSRPFGENLERLEGRVLRPSDPPVPIADALAALRATLHGAHPRGAADTVV